MNTPYFIRFEQIDIISFNFPTKKNINIIIYEGKTNA